MKISIIVPIFNEEKNIIELNNKINLVMEGYKYTYEIIYINDGSKDKSYEILSKICTINKTVRLINFRKNFGQTAAIMAGIDNSNGEILVPIDGDLQNDPCDIPRLINELENGFDVVSGWRKSRKDSIVRKIPSLIANYLISFISNVKLHDYGCTLKAYRRSVLEDTRLYGEMHRFIPIYASWLGAKVTEIVVTHHERKHGKSNYGMNRIIKVILDLILIKFMSDFSTKPIYVFGGIGLLSLFFSLLIGVYTLYLKLYKGISLISTPLPLLITLVFITGLLCLLMGLLAEIIMRTYYESQQKKSYSVLTEK